MDSLLPHYPTCQAQFFAFVIVKRNIETIAAKRLKKKKKKKKTEKCGPKTQSKTIPAFGIASFLKKK